MSAGKAKQGLQCGQCTLQAPACVGFDLCMLTWSEKHLGQAWLQELAETWDPDDQETVWRVSETCCAPAAILLDHRQPHGNGG